MRKWSAPTIIPAMLARLNPFRTLPNKRAVWAWGMYDLANQSFTLLINTLLFALFFKEVVVTGDGWDDTLWSAAVAASLALTMIASPIAGAMADYRAWKKPALLATGLACALLTCAMGLIPPGAVAIAMLIYIPANFAFAMGETFLGAFLPEIATRRTMGLVSGIGWTMGYVGALVLLILTAAAMKIFGLGSPAEWRPLFVFAGLWFLVMAVPTFLFLPERARPLPTPAGRTLVGVGFARLRDTVRHVRLYRQLVIYLIAFTIYTFGVQAVIYFAGILSSEFGIKDAGLVLFMLQLTVTAGIGAIVTTVFQDRLGHRNTIFLFLGVWIATTLAMAVVALLRYDRQWPLWVIGNGVGFALGGVGTASRAMVGYFTPAQKTAEFFGLWGLCARVAGIGGVLSFGFAKDWLGTGNALLVLAGFFGAGFGLMFLVDEKSGVRAARRAERLYEAEEERLRAGAEVRPGLGLGGAPIGLAPAHDPPAPGPG